MTTRWIRVALAPVVLATAGACVTRTDIRVLQNDLANLKAERNAADSANRAQLERVIATLGAVSDSMLALTARSSRYQATVQQDMYAMQQQLVTIQELTGQSQRRLQELRASMEQRAQELATQAAAPAPAPANTGVAAPAPTTPTASSPTPSTAPATPPAGTVTPAPGSPGPNQLFQLALDQLRRGSTGSARAAFQDLLRQYPQSDVAGDAQFYIAESYATEGKAPQADSVYALVVTNHPTSSRAATALYKRGVAAEAAGRPADARGFYEGVVRQFPRSDEAALARDRLAALK